MPVRDIRTRLTIEGEKELKQELAAAAREMRVLESGMKAAGAGFDAAGDDMGKLESNSRSLRAQLAQQEQIVKGLSNAVRDSATAYGDAASETDGWRIKLNNALTKQENLKKAIRDTDREMDELARGSVRAGRQLENGLGESAEEVTKDLRTMYEEFNDAVDEIKNSTGFSAFSDAWNFGSGIVTGMQDFVSENREFRRTMSFLQTNAEAAGLDYGKVLDLYTEIGSLTGETEGAVEGLSNLIASGMDIEQMARAVDILGGAVIRFPDTLKFESLSDGLQETIKTRAAAGSYAELLDRMGVSVDEFNKAMNEAKTDEEAQQVALSYASHLGLEEIKASYEERNRNLLEAQQKEIELTMAWAKLAEEIEPFTTGIIDIEIKLIDEILEFVGQIKEFLKTGNIMDLLFPKAGEKEVPEESRIDTPEAQAEMEKLGAELSAKMGMTEEEAKTAGKKYAEAAIKGVKEVQHEGKAGETFGENLQKEMGLGDYLAAGAEWIDKLFGWGEGNGAEEKAKEFANNATETIITQLKADSAGLNSTAFDVGELMMLQMSNGIVSGARVALASMQTSMQNLAAMTTAGAAAGAGGAPNNTSGAGSTASVAAVYLDSKKVGSAVLSTINKGLATSINRATVVGK